PYTQQNPSGILHTAASYNYRGTPQHSRVDSPRQPASSLPPPLYLASSSGTPILPNQSVGSAVNSSQTPSVPQIYTNQQSYYPVAYNHRNQGFNDSEAMAVHPIVTRQMYPSIGAYHPSQAASPTSMHPSHQDLQTRGMYGQGYGFPQQMFAYPQYALHTHPAYATQPPPQSYAPVSPPGSAILMSQPTTSAVHSSPSQAIPASPRTKIEPAHLKLEYPLMKPEPSYMQRPMSSVGTAPSVAAATSSPPSGTGTNTAAPGPIPATTPLVVRQDQ
ncbi:hypothetical protein KCU79_g20900, partial [Aureobasidium melanogenum]